MNIKFPLGENCYRVYDKNCESFRIYIGYTKKDNYKKNLIQNFDVELRYM
jgi:hypothetical protein